MANQVSTPILKASGLNTQPNQLSVPEGSLIVANNVVINRDNVIEPRRGFTQYGTPIGSSGDVASQLLEYQTRILRNYNDVLQWDTLVENSLGESIFDTFSGSYEEVIPGLRMKSVQANKNLYFTTADGIKKISAVSADDFSTAAGYITNAGGIKALDISTALAITYGSSDGFLDDDSAVAYRAVWGIRDANNNVILGTPSSRSDIFNSLLNMNVRDFNDLLYALDQLNVTPGSVFNDANYMATLGLALGASTTTLRTNLLALAAKLDAEVGTLFTSGNITNVVATTTAGVTTCVATMANDIQVFGDASIGDPIYLTGFTGGTAGTVNGIQVLTNVTNNGTNSILTFIVTPTSGVDVPAGTFTAGSIQYGFFRSIEEPASPSTPATHDDDAACQTYLLAIIDELKNSNNLLFLADNDGTAAQNPLEISSASVTSNVLTITFAAATNMDPRNQFKTGDYVMLEGTWTGTGAVNISGLKTLTNVTATTIVMATTVADGAVTIDTSTQISKVVRFTNALQTSFITPLAITRTANVNVTVTIPPDVTIHNFYQIYRSHIVTAIGTDVLSSLTADNEFRLVFEGFPTAAEIAAGTLTVLDDVPESFVSNQNDLYTNENSGEGELQANDIPPLSQDINTFKNYTWYANTKTRQRDELFLLGVANILTDYNNGLAPSLLISDGTISNEYRFVKGVNQVSQITTNAGSTLAASGAASYFLLNSANNSTQYYFWYSIGTATDPAISGKTGIVIYALAGDTNTTIASHTRDRINTVVDSFTASSNYTFTVTAANATVGATYENNGQTFTVKATISGGTTLTTFGTNAPASSGVLTKNSGTGDTAINFTSVALTNILTITNIAEGPSTNVADGTSGFTFSTPTSGAGESVKKQITAITCVAGSLYVTSGTADYFTINTPFSRQLYAFWFNVSGGTMVAPVLSGRTVTAISILNTDTNAQVATKVAAALTTTGVFTNSVASNVVTATTLYAGPTTNATEVVANAGFTISTTQSGALNVLLSNNVLPSIANQETSLSLVHVINENAADIVNAFYLSGINQSPGDFLLEAKSINTPTFYVLANALGTGASFNPDLSPSVINISNTAASPTVVTATAHGISNGHSVVITGSNSFPIIDGVYTVSNVTANTFTVPVNVITPGTLGAIKAATSAEASDNETKPNRVFYSKLQQPEAVPLVNFLDVGSENKAILRIFPLRDSLFVFKEDGLFRISSLTPPWNVSLFDGTAKLIASDSLGTTNNLIYGWFNQGISTVSEAGVRLISRPIDTIIQALPQYINFSTATWGTGYESDNAYYVYTTIAMNDTVATVCFRYGNLTQTWTSFDKTNTCGIIYSGDGKLYMGAGDVNDLEKERKSFTRLDYADRQYAKLLPINSIYGNGTVVILDGTTNTVAGDVLVQEQQLTIYTYNMLLKKLDLDTQIHDPTFFSSLEAVAGDNLRTKISELALKLDQTASLSIDLGFLPTDINVSTNTFTIPSHGLSNGDPVLFSSDATLPGGITSTDFYFIINASTNTFQISATYNGAVLDITSQGTGNLALLESKYQWAIVERNDYPITSISATDPTVVTSTNNGMQTGRVIFIDAISGESPDVEGIYTVTSTGVDTFTVPVDVVTAGTGGVFTTQINSFDDIAVCYNLIIALLNADSGAAFTNYSPTTTTSLYEAVILAVNTSTGQITLDLALPYVAGVMTVYKKIETEFIYSPITLGDPVGFKQLRESTVMFQNKTFTSAILSFSTDLLPVFVPVPFSAFGTGLFGHDVFGNNFFGGNSHSAPFRTIVPRQCQRCRYINIRFTHAIAREKYSIYGITLTGRIGLSSRAYR